MGRLLGTLLTSDFLHSTPTSKCCFEIADKVGLLDQTLNTRLMAFLIHKRLRNLSYVRHSRLVFYAIRCTISNFSASSFHDCVSKVMVVSKKANFCIVAITSSRIIAYSS